MADRTLAGSIALKGDWLLGEDNWKADMDTNLVKLSVLVQPIVLNTVSATPGAPTEGDVYLLDETHPTHANAIAAYNEGAWFYITPEEGWQLYDQTNNARLQFDGTVWLDVASGPGVPYNVPMGFTSTPLAGEILLLHVFPEAVTFPDDWAGAESYVGVNPTTDPVAFDIKKNGGSVGTVSITAAGVVTFTTSGTTVAFAAGDVLSVHGPGAADATIANVALTFVGDRP